MGDPETCVYHFIYNEMDIFDKIIIQYFIMHGLGLCIKVDIHVSHMFYAWPFSHNAAVPISIEKNRNFLSLNKNTTVFSWGGL